MGCGVRWSSASTCEMHHSSSSWNTPWGALDVVWGRQMIRSTNLSPPKLIPKLSFLRPPPLSREIRPGFTLEVCCVIVHSCHKSTQHRDTCPVWRAPNKPCALQKLQLVLAGNLTTPGKPGLPTDLWFFRLFLYLSLFKSLKRETSHFFLKLRQWHNVSTAGNFPLAQLW